MQYKLSRINKEIFVTWIIRVILIALIILWMGVIFGFSSENGEESQSLSDKITVKVVKVIEPDYDLLDANEQREIFNKVSFLVRKTGHFGEYGILGILVACLLITFKKISEADKAKLKMIAITMIVCMLYATGDEFHQGFVDGRSPKVMDVLIDTAGGSCGAVFVVLVRELAIRIRKSQKAGF